MTLPTRTLKEIARIAAEKVWNEPELSAPQIIDELADAVAIAVLREGIGRLHQEGWSSHVLNEMLAEFDAPGAQENGVTTAPNPRGADTGKGLPPSPEVQPSYQCEDRLGIDGKTYRCDSVEGHEGSHSHGPTIRWQTPAPGAQEKEKNDGTTEEDQVQALETHSGREEADRPSRATGAGTTSSVAPAGVADVEAVAPEPTPGAQETPCQDRLGMGGKTYQCALLEGHKGMHAHDPMIMWSTPDQGAQERTTEKNDSGAGLAAVGNDTGPSTTETARERIIEKGCEAFDVHGEGSYLAAAAEALTILLEEDGVWVPGEIGQQRYIAAYLIAELKADLLQVGSATKSSEAERADATGRSEAQNQSPTPARR